MVSRSDVLIFGFILLGCIHYSDTLLCYQCGDSSKDGPCVTDTAGMEAEYLGWNDTSTTVNDHKQEPYKYLKNCSNTGYDSCVIERIEESGQMHAYIRDCSSGKNFSTPDIPQFAYLEPKLNHTICVYRTKILYCVTLCNSGDFCNGPQIDSGCIHPPAQMWIILSIVLTLFITRI